MEERRARVKRMKRRESEKEERERERARREKRVRRVMRGKRRRKRISREEKKKEERIAQNLGAKQRCRVCEGCGKSLGEPNLRGNLRLPHAHGIFPSDYQTDFLKVHSYVDASSFRLWPYSLAAPASFADTNQTVPGVAVLVAKEHDSRFAKNISTNSSSVFFTNQVVAVRIVRLCVDYVCASVRCRVYYIVLCCVLCIVYCVLCIVYCVLCGVVCIVHVCVAVCDV